MTTSDDLLSRLFQVTVAMSDAMDEDLADRGLTRARATLITRLHEHGPSIQSVLATSMHMSPRNITGLVNGLEASGLAIRSPSPDDGRAVVVALTESGERAARALRDDHGALAAYLFAGISATNRRELAARFDAMSARLGDPKFGDLRRSSLRRWAVGERADGGP